MGASTSSLVGVAANEQILRFVSPEALIKENPFWNSVLSFEAKTPRCKSGWNELEQHLDELLKRFSLNNIKSGNFGALIDIFVDRAKELKSSVESDSSLFVWQSFNALFILRVCAKYFVEKLKEDDVLRQFEALPKKVVNGEEEKETETGDNRMELFVESLIHILVDLPLSDLTYGLHSEAACTLLILLSGPLFSSKPAFQMKPYRIVMTSERALQLTATLLRNFSEQRQAPPAYISEEGGSLVLGLASGVWNVLTLGYSSVATAPTEGDDILPSKPLADTCLQLVLVLTNHCTDCSSLHNPYKELLSQCGNTIGNNGKLNNLVVLSDYVLSLSSDKSSTDSSSVAASGPSFQADFGQLFQTLCVTLSNDKSTLLLYLLLHQNPAFRSHVIASSEIERLVLPLLRTLYHAPTSSNHHIYMSLIVLLILSEDDLFNTSVHDVAMRNVEWYTERSLSEISLGGLLILVVIRTIQYNMLKMRDKYLHTNCLAALANMSSQFRNLHPYVSQRIVSMFEALARKHARLIETVHNSGEPEGLDEDSPLSEALADVSVLEEVLRMILEIVNSTLVNQIKNNSNLIYTLLYKKELFEPYITHPAFQDLSQNLQTVISYFNLRLEQIELKKDRTLSVNEVQDVIRQTAMQFPREKLTKFPDLKFKYVEEEQPEDFFVPYIWTLATQRIYWGSSSNQKQLVQQPNL